MLENRLYLYPVLTLALLAFVLGASARADEPASAAPVAAVVEPVRLDADWLGGEYALSERHVDRLLELAHRDPETEALVTAARRVLGASTTAQLLAMMRICGDDQNGSITGLANVSALIHLESRSTAELVGQAKPDHRASLERELRADERVTSVVEKKDYVLMNSATRDSICIVRGASLESAFSTFVHELTHLANLEPVVEDESFLERYPNAQAFGMAKLMEKGSEFDANYQGMRARIRLTHTRAGLPDWARELFNDNGDLLDRARFASNLLTTVGYGALYDREYQSQLVHYYNVLGSRESFLVNVHNERAAVTRSTGLASAIRDTAYASTQRLRAEIDGLRELRKRYLSRFAAEGIQVTVNP